MSDISAEHCMICKSQLHYNEAGKSVICNTCGKEDTSSIICPSGHYVCDRCHSAKSLTEISGIINRSNAVAPEDILEDLLLLPGLPMHGPEHHAISGLSLLAACERNGTKLPDNYIEETIRRSMQIPGGACGYHGACGGAVSLGVAVSIITEATPIKGVARGIAHRATAMALLKCGDNDARCCKRALRKTVTTGREFFATELGIEFPGSLKVQTCHDVSRNKECAKERCPYY